MQQKKQEKNNKLPKMGAKTLHDKEIEIYYHLKTKIIVENISNVSNLGNNLILIENVET